MRVLVDSCILIDFLSGREQARAYLLGVAGAAIRLVTWMEVTTTARVHGRTLASRTTRDFRPGEVGVDVPCVV